LTVFEEILLQKSTRSRGTLLVQHHSSKSAGRSSIDEFNAGFSHSDSYHCS